MEILETTSQSIEIEKLITNSNEFTLIVSPYIKINSRLKPKLAECFKRNKGNILLYREDSLKSNEKIWFTTFKNVTLLPIKNLHAKCYLNETTALITSMNLYDYSQINNHEIGIKLLKEIDSDKIEMVKLLKYIEHIIKTDHESFILSYLYKYNKIALSSTAEG